MKIRKLEKSDGKILLTLLLALDNETTFMLYEPGERKSTSEEIESRIEAINNDGGVFLGVEQNKELVGFISASRGSAKRIKHSAYIVIGVLNKESGKGLGTKLLSRVDDWALKNNISKLELTVMVHNARAFELYKRKGFEVEGVKKDSIIIDGEMYDEYYMGKRLP